VIETIPFEGDVVDKLFGDAPIRRAGSTIKVSVPATIRPGLDWIRVVIVTDSAVKKYMDFTFQTAKGIFAQPKAAYFGSMKLGTSATRTITIEHPTKDFKVDGIICDNEFVTARVERVGESNKKYNIVVSANARKAGFLKGAVIVNTDSALYPKIEIPISGLVE
jgi:hypothetical protein